mgnify:CR=1 FL=1
MENGDADLSSLAARAVDQDLLLRRNIAGFCQWKWRGITVGGLPAAGATITMLREGRVSAMENGECSRASPSRLPGTLEWPMTYLRVGATMRQWRRQWKKERYTSISLRGSDA